MTSSESATSQTIDRPPHPDADDHPLRFADKDRNINSLPYLETQNETSDNGCDRILQKENQNNKKTYARILTSSAKTPSVNDSERNTDHNVWISKEHYSEEKKSHFTGYTFVRGKHRTKPIVLANIKARGTIFEEVKTDIMKWCEERNVSISGIFLLAHHSERKFPTFVIRANIDSDDYEKTQNAAFWPETISVREWIVCNDRNTETE